MKLLRRKLTFQLTPLLDLLLIVIFAQYMEMQSTSAREQAETEREKSTFEQKLRQVEDDLAELRRLRDRDRQDRAERQAELAEMRTAAERLRDQLARQKEEFSEELNRALEQRDLVGRLMAELFKVPEELVEKHLKPLAGGEARRSAEEIEKLRKRFQQLSASRDRELVELILKYEELRKWCEIWEVHIDEHGVAAFKLAGRTERIIVRDQEKPPPPPGGLDEDARLTAADFEQRLFEVYKAHRQSLSQAKSVVIIFITYDAATPYLYRKPAIAGLRDAAERMRRDAGGRPRFEYAVLGIVNPS